MRGHRGRVMGRHREKRALYKPRREALEKNNPADTLIADLWRRAMWDDTFLRFEPCLCPLWWPPEQTTPGHPSDAWRMGYHFRMSREEAQWVTRDCVLFRGASLESWKEGGWRRNLSSSASRLRAPVGQGLPVEGKVPLLLRGVIQSVWWLFTKPERMPRSVAFHCKGRARTLGAQVVGR